MDEFGRMALREHQALQIARRQHFWLHFTAWAAVSVFIFCIWLLTTRGWPWFLIPILAWAIFVAVHWAYAYVVRDPEEILITRERLEAGCDDKPDDTGASS